MSHRSLHLHHFPTVGCHRALCMSLLHHRHRHRIKATTDNCHGPRHGSGPRGSMCSPSAVAAPACTTAGTVLRQGTQLLPYPHAAHPSSVSALTPAPSSLTSSPQASYMSSALIGPSCGAATTWWPDPVPPGVRIWRDTARRRSGIVGERRSGSGYGQRGRSKMRRRCDVDD